tara:strand:+ start:522 stop:797 length:276 start_codon:yes stop_codon:yes gene_type:complete
MTKTKKFTKDELDEIKKLQDSNGSLISKFGQIELEIILTNQRLDAIAKEKKNLQSEYEKYQQEERKLVKRLNDKYGAGTVDLSNGEFTPSN